MKERLWALFRLLVPPASDVEHGPPVARIIPFAAATFSAAILTAYFLGLPTATDTTLPLFVPPVVLLSMRQTWCVATGFLVLVVACAARAVAAWFVPGVTAGQSFSGMAVWSYLAYQMVLASRMVQARGVRR